MQASTGGGHGEVSEGGRVGGARRVREDPTGGRSRCERRQHCR